MNLKEKLNDPVCLFTILRALCVAVGILGAPITVLLLWMCASSMENTAALAVIAYTAVLLIAACCYAAVVLFFRMCGRIRAGASFTEQNARALFGIALSLAISGCAILAADIAAFVWYGFHPFLPIIELGLLAFAFFAAALLSKALCVLVRRAVALQQENDLTI